MSRKEAPRAGLVKAALAGRITNAQGAQALGVSLRQFRRLKARYREAGVRGLVHRLRGRPSPRAVDVERRDRLRELACPVLLIRGGRRGVIVDDEAAARWEASLPGVEIAMLPDAGHDLWSRDPAAYLAVLRQPISPPDDRRFYREGGGR